MSEIRFVIWMTRENAWCKLGLTLITDQDIKFRIWKEWSCFKFSIGICFIRLLVFIWILTCLCLCFYCSIFHCAMRRYLIYSDANFEVFRPAGATRCTDGGEIWHGGGERRSPTPCQISPPSVQRLGYRTPKTAFFTQIWSKCGI